MFVTKRYIRTYIRDAIPLLISDAKKALNRETSDAYFSQAYGMAFVALGLLGRKEYEYLRDLILEEERYGQRECFKE